MLKLTALLHIGQFSDFRGGSLVMVTINPPDENSRTLLQRFYNVFGQSISEV